MNYPYRLNEFAIMFFPELCAFFSRPNIITNSLKHYDEEKNILDEIFGTIWMNWISRCWPDRLPPQGSVALQWWYPFNIAMPGVSVMSLSG